MTNSTALKAGSYHSIRSSAYRTGLTKVSNAQVCAPTQRSISGRTTVVGGARSGAAGALRMNTPCGDLPTGMLPVTFRVARSTMAMRRRKRWVTHSSLPSGVMSMQSGPPGTRTVPTTFISWVSISETVPSTRLLRNQWRPSPLGQKLCAPLPVCSRPVVAPVAGSSVTTASSPVSATSRRLSSGSMTTPAGALPTSTFHLMACVSRSNATTRLLCCRLTNTVVEALSKARWLGMPLDEGAVGEREGRAVVAVDVDVIEPVGGGDEPLAVRAEAELVGIDDAADRALALAGLGVERDQLVGHGRGDQHFLAVGRLGEVMRLAAERHALPVPCAGRGSARCRTPLRN